MNRDDEECFMLLFSVPSFILLDISAVSFIYPLLLKK